ncbi:hypothetical protein JKP88DRAFT_272508 [Tribonema minus]|uniref:PDZ domain-containing protein n=1 Tax=Tribonema minus TaxID=303371 RepID=A0A836CI86_9STRA|nr:hypothetical protein JKP88DRAFT_272508 [Tribonema minus]
MSSAVAEYAAQDPSEEVFHFIVGAGSAAKEQLDASFTTLRVPAAAVAEELDREATELHRQQRTSQATSLTPEREDTTSTAIAASRAVPPAPLSPYMGARRIEVYETDVGRLVMLERRVRKLEAETAAPSPLKPSVSYLFFQVYEIDVSRLVTLERRVRELEAENADLRDVLGEDWESAAEDLTAVFDDQATNQLNNEAAAVRAKLAFTAGDCKEFIAALNTVAATGGYAAYDLSEDCTFKRAFWATREEVELAMEFGLDVVQQDFKQHLRLASRAPTERCFESAWQALHQCLADAGKAEGEVVTYLHQTIYAIRRRWAFCFRLGVLTVGINSTQHCEGYFAKLKAELEKLGTLCSLNTTLGRITARYRAEDQLHMEASTRALDVAVNGINAALRSIYGALLEVAKHHGTLHCLKHIAQEVGAAARYHVEIVDEGRETVSVITAGGGGGAGEAQGAGQGAAVNPAEGRGGEGQGAGQGQGAGAGVGDSEQAPGECAAGATAANRSGAASAAPAYDAFEVTLCMRKGEGLGVKLAFGNGTVIVEAFTRSENGGMLAAEASELTAIGDIITAIDCRRLQGLPQSSAERVLKAARRPRQRLASPAALVIRKRRTQNTVGKRNKGSTGGARKKPKA